MTKAIIFDIDGVLVDSKNANVALFQAVLKKAGYPPSSREEILASFHLTAWQTIERLTGSHDKAEVERVWNLVKDPSVRNAQLFEFPEKLESTLGELHKKYKLAIVSGRIKSGVEEIFGLREIKHLFDVVVSYEDYKNPKPHPEPLLVALKRLGVSADEAIYIGDSKTDIESARAAGTMSIYLSNEAHEQAHANISEFNELLEAIKLLT